MVPRRTSHLRHGFVLAGAATVVAGGCAWVAGVDVDYRLDDGSGGNGAGGGGTGGGAGGACDANVSTDIDNCGSCGRACPVRANSVPGCEQGECVLLCNDGYDDCDGQENTGCETSVESNPDHCGGCNDACADVCEAGRCVPTVLVEANGGAWDVVVDATHIYWTEVAPGHVKRCEKVACDDTDEVISFGTAVSAGSLTLDGSHLYWTSPEADKLLRCQVDVRSTTCASPQLVASLELGLSDAPFALTIHGGYVYFTAGPAVWRVIADGSAPDSAEQLVANGVPRGITHDGARLYWTDLSTSGTLHTCDVATCGSMWMDMMVSAPGAWRVTHDATHLFWAGTDAVGVVRKDAAMQQVLAVGLAGPTIMPFGDLVFFSSGGDGGYLASMPKAGGEMLKLAEDLLDVRGIFVEGDAVYFTQYSDSDGSVSRIAH